MSFLLVCPNCGPRDVSEFRYGGQVLPAPAGGGPAGSNLPGPQRERWYHRQGCRRWLLAQRDVRSNEVLRTGWLGEEPSALSPRLSAIGQQPGTADSRQPTADSRQPTADSRVVTFSFNGRPVRALSGQSIAAALYAADVRIFSRSFKYHRPRGLFCVSGDCPNCLMEVNGRPNVRTCVEPARHGQVVRHQNAWPSLNFDVLRIFDRLDSFLPVGFYYRRFHKPRWLWPLVAKAIRHVAGLGKIDIWEEPATPADVEHLHTDVCVIGGGPAGLAAAAEAATAGASVLLLEREPRPGGHLLYGGEAALLEPLLNQLQASSRARVLCGTTAFGLYEGNLVGAFQTNRLLKVRARQVVVCTGGRQQPFLFHNNDLPGIFLGRGVQRLARLHGLRAGRRAVVLTDNDQGASLAQQLTALGIEVAAVVDRRPATTPGQGQTPWPTLAAGAVLAAHGGKQLASVRVAGLREDGTIDPGSEQEIGCDLLCLVSGLAPAQELLRQAGLELRYQDGRWLADRPLPGLLAAGAVLGTLDLEAQVLEGRLRGAEAAAALGYQTPSLDSYRPSGPQVPFFPSRGANNVSPAVLPRRLDDSPAGWYQARAAERKRFVCLCEDVTAKDLERAVAEGFDHSETLKRYATAGMGVCQGKMCSQAVAAICARAKGCDLAAVGATTSRPPVVPVELGVLAADRQHQPIRRTPLHHWHETIGASWMDAGLWKRPESYGDPVAEVQAVRTGVGLIDVSTLGKIEVAGPDAAELLERVYLNKWADLKPGRARYGALCTEEGILFDDGVGARLGPDRFYLTATTGNAEAVFGWLELWRATWQLEAVVSNQTSAWAAMNLAGPQARAVLARLTALDVSPSGFPYMAMREGEVAGVACRLLRIGFVGEVGYEIHCPAAQAWHLWEALVQAGAEFRLRPFGVEAQRVLRLEKGHLIIGQDTDALSNPLDAGLSWLVRFDKPFFHGREFLLRLQAMGSRSRLIGFQLKDGGGRKQEESERIREEDERTAEETVGPRPFVLSPSSFLLSLEGCQVVEQGRPVGRVTSARHSPTLGQSIGLAWVPAAQATAGQPFLIRHNGADVPAVVTSLPFYDPEGKRLKE